MNTLILDSATPVEVIMVQRGDLIADFAEQVNISHSVTMFKNIELCLKKLDLTIQDIDLIGVGIGPGSFTGIRIAVTTARMFAQILGVPLVGLKTQEIYAVSIDKAEAGDTILICFDAKKGRVFGALYRKEIGKNLVEIVTPGDYYIEELLKKIDINNKTWAAGDGISRYYSTIGEILKNIAFIESFYPSGKAVCELVQERYRRSPGEFRDINSVVPYYSRKSDAEIARRGT